MRPTKHQTTALGVALAVAIAAVATLNAPRASAAATYTGEIGRIDVRTGHADPAVYKNGIVVRDAAASVICVVAPDAENMDQFLSLATAAMLAGKNVTIERGGVLNNQYKCYQIMVRR